MLTLRPEPLDVRVCDADLQHHIKYLGRGGRGHSTLPGSESGLQDNAVTLSPVEAVQLGVEPVEYLKQFGPDSYWYPAIQAFERHQAGG